MGHRPIPLHALAALSLGLAAIGGAARAGTPDATTLPLAVPGSATTFANRDAEAELVRAAVLPKRSIDRKLSSDRVTGSAGFLCGLQPNMDGSGSSKAAGYDPHGRFIGAKLSFAFR